MFCSKLIPSVVGLILLGGSFPPSIAAQANSPVASAAAEAGDDVTELEATRNFLGKAEARIADQQRQIAQLQQQVDRLKSVLLAYEAPRFPLKTGDVIVLKAPNGKWVTIGDDWRLKIAEADMGAATRFKIEVVDNDAYHLTYVGKIKEWAGKQVYVTDSYYTYPTGFAAAPDKGQDGQKLSSAAATYHFRPLETEPGRLTIASKLFNTAWAVEGDFLARSGATPAGFLFYLIQPAK